LSLGPGNEPIPKDMDLIKRKLAACLEQSTDHFKVTITIKVSMIIHRWAPFIKNVATNVCDTVVYMQILYDKKNLLWGSKLTNRLTLISFVMTDFWVKIEASADFRGVINETLLLCAFDVPFIKVTCN
jgi:hypothetical protein